MPNITLQEFNELFTKLDKLETLLPEGSRDRADVTAMKQDWVTTSQNVIDYDRLDSGAPRFFRPEENGPLMSTEDAGYDAQIAKRAGMSMEPSEYREAVLFTGADILRRHNPQAPVRQDPAPAGIRFSQAQANHLFSRQPGVPESLSGKTVNDVANSVRNGEIPPEDFQIRYFIRDGYKVAINNRGFATLQQAGVATPPRMIPEMSFSDTEKRMTKLGVEGPRTEIELEGQLPITRIRVIQLQQQAAASDSSVPSIDACATTSTPTTDVDSDAATSTPAPEAGSGVSHAEVGSAGADDTQAAAGATLTAVNSPVTHTPAADMFRWYAAIAVQINDDNAARNKEYSRCG